MTFRKPVVAALVLGLLAMCPRADAADGVVRETLPNGLRVVIVPTTLAPVVTVDVSYLVGGVDSPDGFPGMAHAQEHMMFRGNPGLSAAQFSAISADLGGDMNAGTSQVATEYHLTVPSDALGVALRIESIRMRGVLDRQEDWVKERGAIEQEVATDLSDPNYTFLMRLLKTIYPGTPYDRTALGTRESFGKTTAAMLQKFYRDWYAPNNAILVVAGDVDPAKALPQIRRLFGPVPKRALPPRRKFELGPPVADRIAMDTDQPTGRAIVAYRLPGFESPDFAAGVILADVLDSRRGELYALVPQGKALTAQFVADVLPKSGYGYAEATFPKGADGEALIARLKEIAAGYAKDGVPADLVEAARRHELADAAFMKNSVEGLAFEWAQALAMEGRNSPDDDVEAIRKVTVEDVNRVAAEYLVNGSAVTALLSPRESGNPVAARPAAGAESFSPRRAKDARIPSWAKRAVKSPAAPAPRVTPSDTTLPNGIRLIVRPESISPTVTLVGRIRNDPDVQVLPGKEGVAHVLDRLLPYGSESLDRVAFRKALDDIGAEAAAGTVFSLRVLSDRFERGVQLLADQMLHPALPDNAFRVVREQAASTVEGQIRTPSYLAWRALQSGLFPKTDPSLRQPTRETVASLSLGDVRSYYEKAFRPDLATIVVVGQTTPEQARAVVERYFGEWKAAGPKPETDPPAVPPNRASAAEVPNDIRVQVDATLAATVGITRFDPDYYALQVGTSVLSGGFYAARLTRHLREEAGLVYNVGARLDAGRTRSVFSVNFACDPGDVSRARGMVVRDLEAMRAHDVSPTELGRAKSILVRRLALSEASVDSIARTLAQLANEGLPLDEPSRAAKRYLGITAPDVRESFRKWIRPADLVQVTEGPPPR